MLRPNPLNAGTIYRRERRGLSICVQRLSERSLNIVDCVANVKPLRILIIGIDLRSMYVSDRIFI